MGIRYSQIIGELFYHIKLSDEVKDMVDTHFTGASHHLRRFEQAKTDECRFFHLSRHRIHLRLMMSLIYKLGDFSEAIDSSNRDLDRRETWSPEWTIMPDQNMFRKMQPDWRYEVGVAHAADIYIHDEDWLNYSLRSGSSSEKRSN